MIKTIHQIWIGENSIPNFCLPYIEFVKSYNKEYEYILWDNDRVNKYFKNDKKYLELLSNKVSYAHISDYLRFKILYDFGGWYVDIDNEAINTFDKVTTEKSCIISPMGKMYEFNTLYSEKENIIFREFYESIQTNNQYFVLGNHMKDFIKIINKYKDNIFLIPERYLCARLRSNALIIYSHYMNTWK